MIPLFISCSCFVLASFLHRFSSCYRITDRVMATKPSAAPDKALQKISVQERVICGICLEPYKQPKLLKCFHTFCEQCLQRLVRGAEEGLTVRCPICHKETVVPVEGVQKLEGALKIHYHFEISCDDRTMCENCEDRGEDGKATGFCRTCGFVCGLCNIRHMDWDRLNAHEMFYRNGFSTGDFTILVPPKEALFCSKHQDKEADVYCAVCEEYVFYSDCRSTCYNHEFKSLPNTLTKAMLINSLKPVGEQIAMLERAVESVNTQCAAVMEQKTVAVAEIHTAMAHLRQLVGQAEQTAQQKLNTLAAQRDKYELQLGQLRSSQDLVEESQRTCSQWEILRMKSPLVQLFKPLPLPEQPDMVAFAHHLPELVTTCQQFSKMYHPAVSKESKGSIKVAKR